jgi:anti-sigma factor ChrR (cupin superfamily)
MHLSSEALAGYLDGDLAGEEQSQVELHLASCPECRDELAQIRRLQLRRRRKRALLLVPAAAAAAVLLSTTLLRQGAAPSDTRAGPSTDSLLEIVSPAPSAEIDRTPITFIWRSAGPGATYTLTLQEPDGRVVWTSTGVDTYAVAQDSLELSRGLTWFWSVDALLPDGRSRSTGVKRLRTGQ